MPKWIIKPKKKGEYNFPVQDEGLLNLPIGFDGLVSPGQTVFDIEGFLRFDNKPITFHYKIIFGITFFLN